MYYERQNLIFYFFWINLVHLYLLIQKNVISEVYNDYTFFLHVFIKKWTLWNEPLKINMDHLNSSHWWPKVEFTLILKVDFWAVGLVRWVTWVKNLVFNGHTILYGQDAPGYEQELSLRFGDSSFMIQWLNTKALLFRSPLFKINTGFSSAVILWSLSCPCSKQLFPIIEKKNHVKLVNIFKSCIQETLNPLTNAASSTNTKQNPIHKTFIFFVWNFFLCVMYFLTDPV